MCVQTVRHCITWLYYKVWRDSCAYGLMMVTEVVLVSEVLL
jgi:hypothetical protein